MPNCAIDFDSGASIIFFVGNFAALVFESSTAFVGFSNDTHHLAVMLEALLYTYIGIVLEYSTFV